MGQMVSKIWRGRMRNGQCLFLASLGRNSPPPQKKPYGAKLCALNLFFSAGTMNYKYKTEIFFNGR